MKDMETENLPMERAVGDFLGIVRCLSWITDINAFKNWMNKYHHMEFISAHLPGYKLLFHTLLRMLISVIEENLSLGLSSDELFDRASFRGKSVYRLPNTCEKTILIKNIAGYVSEISDSRDWDALSNVSNTFSDQVINELRKIENVSRINTRYDISDIDTAILYSSVFQVYIFLNDTSRGFPHGYTAAMLEDFETIFGSRHKIDEDNGDTFYGYKYGVQYLWFQLLGERVSKSIIADLHRASDWASFDKYFERIRNDIIVPIEKHSRSNIGFDSSLLICDSPKRFLKALLTEVPQEKAISLKEQIKQFFLWYPIYLLDSSEYSFCGVPTLIPMLMGMIQTKRRQKNKTKAKVIRIIHGTEQEHRRNYSYAVLSELRGFISDASGWVLFYNCCSDRGSTSGLYYDVESLLDRYVENEFIEISNIRVEKKRFIELIKDDIIETNLLPEGLG